MKRFKTALVGLMTISTAPLLAADSEAGFVSIFNGTSLEGWDGKPGAWEVREGAIWCTGRSADKNWLVWRKEQPADFILRLEFRWDRGNSGVQVRSDDLGDWKIFGYQVEVAARNKMGLWHHSLLGADHPKKKARHLMTTAGQVAMIEPDGSKRVRHVNDPVEVQSHFNEHEWNSMELIVRGSKLVQKINGEHFATVVDQDSEMSRKQDFIALQDHGKGCVVAFRNLCLKQLP